MTGERRPATPGTTPPPLRSSAMFDKSSLPEADLEFVVLSDTHYMLPAEDVEFESRREQTDRAAHALALVESLDPDFVVHLGDLVQEFPGREAFDRALDRATEQLAGRSMTWHHVAGNHDVGDKPDPLMPTAPTTEDALETYHDRFGRSWYSWERAGIQFVVVNSQLLNSSLPEAERQREWLESELRDSSAEPALLFSHLPPFVHRETEPSTGHYDNVGRSAREWLLELIEETGVAHVFSGHCHFEFHDRVGETAFQVVPSPSFTRPGFGELFSSCPPPERGRDDRGKLGFYLVRIRQDEVHCHRIGTHGHTESGIDDDERRLLTRTTRSLPDSPVGASLLQPFSETAQVPATFPSSIRQPVGNDYPLLACVQTGIATIRTAARDATDDPARRNLEAFRRTGGTVVATLFDDATASPTELGTVVDEIELRLPGTPYPNAATAERIASLRDSTGAPIGLSTTVPSRSVAGKQHDRLRTGYSADELEALDDRLAELDCDVDRVLCGIDASSTPWEAVSDAPRATSLRQVGAVDFLVRATDVEPPGQLRRAAEAVFAVAARRDARCYLEPLRSLDRTMDAARGLLDRRCNPTPALHAVRCLNTVLFGPDTDWARRSTPDHPDARIPGLAGDGRVLRLVLPEPDESVTVDPSADGVPEGTSLVDEFSLERGTRRLLDSSTDDPPSVAIDEVTLLSFE